MNIKDIVQNIVELDKTNLFSVICDKLNNFPFYVQDVNIPSKTGKITELMFAGIKIPIPGPYEYGELTITMREDIYMSIRTFIEKWINEIYVQESNQLVDNIPFDSSLTVTSLNDTLQPIMSWQFINAIPKDVGEYAYSYNEEAGFTNIKLTFSYSYYVIKGINNNLSVGSTNVNSFVPSSLPILPSNLSSLPTYGSSPVASSSSNSLSSNLSYSQYQSQSSSQANSGNLLLNGYNGTTGEY